LKLEVLFKKKNSTALVLNFSLASKHYLMKPRQSNINQSTQKRGGIQGTKNGRTTSKKTKEPSKRANHKGNIKVPEPSQVVREEDQSERMASLEEPSPIATAHLKRGTVCCVCGSVTDTFCLL